VDLVRKQYWWDGTPNFGDMIGPDIVAALLGRRLPLAEAGDAGVLLGPGSIIDYCPKFASSVVWGSGIDPHYGKVPGPEVAVRYLAVRGPLSREALGIDVEVLGDPGLLLPKLHPREPEPGPVSVVIHHSTTRRRLRDRLFDPYRSKHRIIDPRGDWREVVDRICASRFVFCQSLHGAIIAQAYGVPWAWWRGFHGRMASFKWRDWFGSLGAEPASFRLGDLAGAERWSARTRLRTPDTVALEQALTENVRAAPETETSSGGARELLDAGQGGQGLRPT